MQRLFTVIIDENNEEKTIHAWVDDQTAAVLKTVDEATRHQYIVDEHEMDLISRKETRRHQSLEASTDNGFDIADESPSVEENIIAAEMSKDISNALSCLTEKQLEILKLVVFEKMGFREIGRKLGLNKDTVSEHYYTAIKKLKNFLE
ncbi:MAG: sigma-70 family RNA polymerase sigma factor [Clostridia bacterium]|nr:sigma-70 family RNA polymerase sigma factor [Clostridia bacterium]